MKSIKNNEIIGRNALLNSVFVEMQDKKPVCKETKCEILVKENKEKKADKKDRIIGLCETLKSVFSTIKTPSIFFINLLKKVGARFEETLKTDLAIVCNLFPQWLSIISTNSGTVIRVNKSLTLTLKSITEELNKAINE